MWHGPFICDMARLIYHRHESYMCDITPICVTCRLLLQMWRDSFVCDITHVYTYTNKGALWPAFYVCTPKRNITRVTHECITVCLYVWHTTPKILDVLNFSQSVLFISSTWPGTMLTPTHPGNCAAVSRAGAPGYCRVSDLLSLQLSRYWLVFSCLATG